VITGSADIGVVVIADTVGVPECIFSRKGFEYKGFMNKTRFDETCQWWTSLTVSIT